MKIVPLTPNHAAAAARLHIAGQPGTFLTSLGPDVLTVFYRALPQSPAGFGFAAIEDSETDGKAIGFVATTTSVGSLFLEMGTKHIVQFLPPLLKRYVQRPQLAIRSVQTVLYPFMVSGEEKQDSSSPNSPNSPLNSAELLSIMVEPTARSGGIGAKLLHALLDECSTRNINLLDVTVDADNAGARRFYERHDFEYHHNFELYGRDMCQYKLGL